MKSKTKGIALRLAALAQGDKVWLAVSSLEFQRQQTQTKQVPRWGATTMGLWSRAPTQARSAPWDPRCSG